MGYGIKDCLGESRHWISITLVWIDSTQETHFKHTLTTVWIFVWRIILKYYSGGCSFAWFKKIKQKKLSCVSVLFRFLLKNNLSLEWLMFCYGFSIRIPLWPVWSTDSYHNNFMVQSCAIELISATLVANVPKIQTRVSKSIHGMPDLELLI